MLKQLTIVAVLFAFFAAEVDAQNRFHRRRGAILGGLAGAAIGVAIGDKGDNETAGALIGGAVGAVAGGAIGNAKDQRIEHNQRYHSGYAPVGPTHYVDGHNRYPAYRTEHPYHDLHHSGALSVYDVLSMLDNGLSEPMVIQQIQLHGMQHPLTVSDVIALHRRGVSEPVISAMQGVIAPAPVPYTTYGTDNYGVPGYGGAPVYGSPTYSNPNPPYPSSAPAESFRPRADGARSETLGPSIMAPANGQ